MGVSAQALDVVYGRSASGLRARLERTTADGCQIVASGETDAGGHLRDWVHKPLEQGDYRIVFDSDSYFASLGVGAVYSEIAVAFVVQDEGDECQIQLLLAPYSYSMFFGTRG